MRHIWIERLGSCLGQKLLFWDFGIPVFLIVDDLRDLLGCSNSEKRHDFVRKCWCSDLFFDTNCFMVLSLFIKCIKLTFRYRRSVEDFWRVWSIWWESVLVYPLLKHELWTARCFRDCNISLHCPRYLCMHCRLAIRIKFTVICARIVACCH